MEHPTKVKDYNGNLKDLARGICNLRYDAFSELIGYLSKELDNDSIADANRASLKYPGRERNQLSGKLEEVANKFGEAKEIIDSIWRICEPYIKK